MFALYDTLNDCTVSRHRTIAAAVKNQIKFNKAVKKRNGQNSYVPTAIIDRDGNDVTYSDEAIAAEFSITSGR